MTHYKLQTISLKDANIYIETNHRHHKKVQGHKFSLKAINENGDLSGVCIVGRPVCRFLDNGTTLEITRLCTTGERNVCSFLYGAARRAAFALGYDKIITYILISEDGASLKASGYDLELDNCGGGSWNNSKRPRIDKHPLEKKRRYCSILK